MCGKKIDATFAVYFENEFFPIFLPEIQTLIG